MSIHEPRRCDDDPQPEFYIETDGMEVDPLARGEPEEDGYEENSGDSDDDSDEEGDKPSLEPDQLPNPWISNSDDTEVSNLDGVT